MTGPRAPGAGYPRGGFHPGWSLVALIPALVLACAPPVDEVPPLALTAVTFNTGTSEGMGHDGPPDDGYTGVHAAFSDQYYGDGLAWLPAVEATRAFLQQVQPDVVGFQEIFHSADCAGIPVEAQPDFVCQRWQPGDPTVAQLVVGEGYQVTCHVGHPDKCAAVKRAFGHFRGCDEDLCLEGLLGSTVEGCGQGARVGRGVVELAAGGELTLVNVHASSGMTDDDMACRTRQVEQVFVDLGDGAPAASGARNLILGDLNTDPGRWADWDPSARRWTDFAGLGKRFHFVSPVGNDAPGTYAGLVTIDHQLSDALDGDCWVAGVSDGHPAVIDALYFDHKPLVCALEAAP